MEAASVFEGLVGETVGEGFVLLEQLGGSADCGVFLTLRQGQRAVIKLIRAEEADANQCLLKWDTAKTLSHPHLAQVYESGRFSRDNIEMVYVVTEHGDELLSQTLQVRSLEDRETRAFLNPVLDALSYLHEKGIVHGHVKPTNIMRANGTVKLAGDNFISCGTVQKRLQRVEIYDAPEVSTGKVTPAADSWSVGMTLAEMVTGTLPEWDRTSNIEPFVSQFLPRPYQDVVLGSLLLDPRQRCRISDMKKYLTMETSFETGGGSAPESWTTKKPPAAGSGQWEANLTSLAEVAETDRKPIPEQAPQTHSPSRRWEEESTGATPVLFSQNSSRYSDEDEEEKDSHTIPVLLAALVLLAFAGFLLVRSGLVSSDWFRQMGSVVTQSKPDSAKQQAPAATTSGTTSAPPQQSTPPPAVQPNTNAPAAKSDTAGSNAQPAPALPAAAPAAPQPSPNANSGNSGGAEASHDADGEVAHRALPTPAKAALSSMRGPVHVTVRVSVNQQGNVAHAEYVSPGQGNYFARISKRAAQSWKFTPPMRKGRAQPSAWTLRFDFTRTSTRATATKQ